MTPPDSLLDELLGFPGVRTAVLAGREGLVIRLRGARDVDAEALAALVPGLVSTAAEAASAMAAGGFRRLVAEFDGGLLVLAALAAGGPAEAGGGEEAAYVALAVHGGANVGQLLWRLEREREGRRAGGP